MLLAYFDLLLHIAVSAPLMVIYIYRAMSDIPRLGVLL